MNYQRIYDQFIADRQIKEHLLKKGEYDTHHKKPKCKGGGNEPGNLIKLSFSDHLFAHILLAKIYGGSLLYVAVRMSGVKKYRGRANRSNYARLRTSYALYMKENMLGNTNAGEQTPELRKKKSVGLKEYWNKPGSRERGSEIAKRAWADQDRIEAARLKAKKEWTPERKRRKSIEARAMGSNPEYRARNPSPTKGKPRSEEFKTKVRATWARKREQA